MFIEYLFKQFIFFKTYAIFEDHVVETAEKDPYYYYLI